MPAAEVCLQVRSEAAREQRVLKLVLRSLSLEAKRRRHQGITCPTISGPRVESCRVWKKRLTTFLTTPTESFKADFDGEYILAAKSEPLLSQPFVNELPVLSYLSLGLDPASQPCDLPAQ